VREERDVVVGDVVVGDATVPAVADVRLGEEVVDQRVDLRPVRGDVPSPQALTRSSWGYALMTSAPAQLSFSVVKCRASVEPSSCAETPRMCRAACAGPRFAP